MPTMTRHPSDLLWICSCCLLKLANDDTSGCDFFCEPDKHPDAHPDGLLEGLSDDDITIGMLRKKHERGCPNRKKHQSGEHYECGCETREFSRTPCVGCGTHLAGSRHAVTLWS